MNKSTEFNNATAPSNAEALHSLIESVQNWMGSVLELAALEGKEAGLALVLILGMTVGATTLFIAGWLTLVGCLVAAFVESNLLSLVWSLVIAALLNFAGAGGLVFFAIKRSQDLRFLATRRQLKFKPKSPPNHDQSY